MAKAHSTPKTQEHLISIIKIIIINENIFADTVEKWNAKPAICQTLPNLKSHFTDGQCNYNKVLPSNTTAYHSYTREFNFSLTFLHEFWQRQAQDSYDLAELEQHRTL